MQERMGLRCWRRLTVVVRRDLSAVAITEPVGYPEVEIDTEVLECLYNDGHPGPCLYLDGRDKFVHWQWPVHR